MAKHTFTAIALASLMGLGACASPQGQRMQTSYEAYRQCLINQNANFDACAPEKAIFEADEKVYNDYTARRAAEPGVVITGGGDGQANFWNMMNAQAAQENAQAAQQNAFWNMVGATRP